MEDTRSHLVGKLMELEKSALIGQVSHRDQEKGYNMENRDFLFSERIIQPSSYGIGSGNMTVRMGGPDEFTGMSTTSTESYSADDEECMEASPIRALKKEAGAPTGSITDITVIGSGGKGNIAQKWMSQIASRESREKEKFKQMQEEKMRSVRTAEGQLQREHSLEDKKAMLDLDEEKEPSVIRTERKKRLTLSEVRSPPTPKQEVMSPTSNKNFKEERNEKTLVETTPVKAQEWSGNSYSIVDNSRKLSKMFAETKPVKVTEESNDIYSTVLGSTKRSKMFTNEETIPMKVIENSNNIYSTVNDNTKTSKLYTSENKTPVKVIERSDDIYSKMNDSSKRSNLFIPEQAPKTPPHDETLSEMARVEAEYFASLEEKRQKLNAQRFDNTPPKVKKIPIWSSPVIEKRSATFFLENQEDIVGGEKWDTSVNESRGESDSLLPSPSRPISWHGGQVAVHKPEVGRTNSYRLKNEDEIERKKYQYRSEIDRWKKIRTKAQEEELSFKRRSFTPLEVTQTVIEDVGGTVIRSWSDADSTTGSSTMSESIDDIKPVITRKLIYDKRLDISSSSSLSDHQGPIYTKQKPPEIPPVFGKKPTQPPSPVTLPDTLKDKYPTLDLPSERNPYGRKSRRSTRLSMNGEYASLAQQLEAELDSLKVNTEVTEEVKYHTMPGVPYSRVYNPKNPYDAPEYYGETPVIPDEDCVRNKLQDLWGNRVDQGQNVIEKEPPKSDRSIKRWPAVLGNQNEETQEGRLNAYKEKILERWNESETNQGFAWSSISQPTKLKRRVTIHSTDCDAKEIKDKRRSERVDFIPLFSTSSVEFKEIKPDPPAYSNVVYANLHESKPQPRRPYKEIERPVTAPQVQYVRPEYTPYLLPGHKDEVQPPRNDAQMEYRNFKMGPPIRTVTDPQPRKYLKERITYPDETIEIRPYHPGTRRERIDSGSSSYRTASTQLPSHDTLSVSSRVSSTAPEWSTLPQVRYSTPVRTTVDDSQAVVTKKYPATGSLRRSNTMDSRQKKGRITSEVTLHLKRNSHPQGSRHGSNSTLTDSLTRSPKSYDTQKQRFFLGGGKDGQMSKDPFFQKGRVVGNKTSKSTTASIAEEDTTTGTHDEEHEVFEGSDNELNSSSDSDDLERKLTECVNDDWDDGSFSDSTVVTIEEQVDCLTDATTPQTVDSGIDAQETDDDERVWLKAQNSTQSKKREDANVKDSSTEEVSIRWTQEDTEHEQGSNEDLADAVKDNGNIQKEVTVEIEESEEEVEEVVITDIGEEIHEEDLGCAPEDTRCIDMDAIQEVDETEEVATTDTDQELYDDREEDHDLHMIEETLETLEVENEYSSSEELAICNAAGEPSDENETMEPISPEHLKAIVSLHAQREGTETEANEEIEIQDFQYWRQKSEGQNYLPEDEFDIEGEGVSKEILQLYKEHVQTIREQAGINCDAFSEDEDDESVLVVAGHDREGCMVCLGRSNYFRFNHPQDAQRRRESSPVKGNSTNSQLRAPYSSYKRGTNGPLEGVADSAQYRDSLEGQDFVQKVSRFEYLTHGSNNGNAKRPSPPATVGSYGSATSPPVRSPPSGGVTYLHATSPGGANVNGSATHGDSGSPSHNGAAKKAATTTISVVLKSPTADKESSVVENGGSEDAAPSVLNASVREDTKNTRQRGIGPLQRPPSPSGPISPIRSVQHKTISFKSPPTTVTSSGNYASSNPQFAHTVAKSPTLPASVATRSPSPSLLQRAPSPNAHNHQPVVTSPPSPSLTRKRTPTPPPRPNREAAKALDQANPRNEPPSSPTARRKFPSSPTVTRKFPISSSPTPARRGLPQGNGRSAGPVQLSGSCGDIPLAPESPKPTRKTAENQSTPKFPTFPESPRTPRKFPVPPESPKPKRKVTESPKLTRKFPTTPESPKLTRKVTTTPESPTLHRKFTIPHESPLLSRKPLTTPESPKAVRKFPVPPESPTLTRKFPTTPESPKPQRKIIKASPEVEAQSPVAAKPPVSPASPKPVRKFPANTEAENKDKLSSHQNGNDSPVKVTIGDVPQSPNANRRGIIKPLPDKIPATPTTPPSPSALRRNLSTPPPVLPKPERLGDHVTPPPVPPHATPIKKGPTFPKHQGEKLFTKDTAIVHRVAIPGFDKRFESPLPQSRGASELSPELTSADSRVVSGVSTASSSSFTSVSSMSSTLSSETAINRDSQQSKDSIRDSSRPESETAAMEVNANVSGPENGVGLHSGSHRDGVALDEVEVDLDYDDLSLTGSQQDLKALHEKMVAERKKEQEMAALEKQRLEEILNMCAEYERQIEQERMATGGTVVMDEKFSVKEEKKDSEGSPSRPESRNSMTKIKTNGSLTMLSSPGTTHKEVSFDWRRRSSNSSASEDDLGSENGTIKRRPNNGHTGLDNLIHGLNSELNNHKPKDTDCPDAGPASPETPVFTEKNNNAASPEVVQGTGMRLQLVKIGDGAYAGPVLRSVTHNGPNATTAELTGTTPPESEGRSPRSPRSYDLRSPGDSDGDRSTRQQLATPSSSGVETSSDLSLNKMEDGEVMSQIDKLKYQRTEAIQKIGHLKQEIVEIETQENEAIRELEMERALLEGEHQMEVDALTTEREKINALKQRQLELLELAALQRQKEQEQMEVEQEKLRVLEARRYQTRQLLEACAPEDEDQLSERLRRDQELLDAQRRFYDDLEFQQLETETRYEEEREKVQRDLLLEQNELLTQYHEHENKLQQIDTQQRDMLRQVKTDIEGLEQQRQGLVEEFRKEKARLSSTEKRIRELSRLLPLEESSKVKDFEGAVGDGRIQLKRSNADYINRIKDESITNSPPTERKMSQTLQEIEKNRLQILESQGNSVIDDECRRLYDLKQRAAQEVRTQWEEKKTRENNYKSFNSLESEESSVGSSGETPSEKETSLSSGEDHLEKLAEMERLLTQQVQADKLSTLEQQLQLNMSYGDSSTLRAKRNAEAMALQEEREKRLELERRLAEETMRRDELVEQEIRLRDQQRHQARPLTRYLPIRNAEFDLKVHIESAGHNLDGAKKHVTITNTTCRGFLNKMGSKFRTWNRRWFLFDRTRRSLLYFSDKSETKPRGGIYFQSIEEVYVDHLRVVKSPNPKLTFCLKTFDRTYYLVAPSPEAMRIWIDVIFTGAEGYQEFL